MHQGLRKKQAKGRRSEFVLGFREAAIYSVIIKDGEVLAASVETERTADLQGGHRQTSNGSRRNDMAAYSLLRSKLRTTPPERRRSILDTATKISVIKVKDGASVSCLDNEK